MTRVEKLAKPSFGHCTTEDFFRRRLHGESRAILYDPGLMMSWLFSGTVSVRVWHFYKYQARTNRTRGKHRRKVCLTVV